MNEYNSAFLHRTTYVCAMCNIHDANKIYEHRCRNKLILVNRNRLFLTWKK